MAERPKLSDITNGLVVDYKLSALNSRACARCAPVPGARFPSRACARVRVAPAAPVLGPRGSSHTLQFHAYLTHLCPVRVAPAAPVRA